MKIIKNMLCSALIISLCSISAIAATYTVNSNGTMTGPNGNAQKISTPTQGHSTKIQQPLYNTVQAKTYTGNVQRYVGQPDVVEIIMDYSGSMISWVQEANRTMSAIIAQIPDTIKVGMRVTGYKKINITSPINVKSGVQKIVTRSTSPMQDYCRASQQLISIGDKSTNASSVLNGVELGGSTPLVYAISQTVLKDFAPYNNSTKKKIILITDGGENCHANPCAYAATLSATRPDIVIDVVLVDNSSGSQFRCFADLTGGNVYTPSQIKNLSNVILNSATNTQQTTPTQTTVTKQQTNVQNYQYVED